MSSQKRPRLRQQNGQAYRNRFLKYLFDPLKLSSIVFEGSVWQVREFNLTLKMRIDDSGENPEHVSEVKVKH